jgi:hypothetical protein
VTEHVYIHEKVVRGVIGPANNPYMSQFLSVTL